MNHRIPIFLAAVLFCMPAAAAAEPDAGGPTATGWACILDGDSLAIGGKLTKGRCEGGVQVRLHGVDAPEWDQVCQDAEGKDWKCGKAAKKAMIAMVRGQVTSCQLLRKPDKYDRFLGACFAGGQNLGQELVRKGLAVAYRRYSMRYAIDEDLAKVAKRGLWAGTFDMPEDHRHAKRNR